eukprot:GHVQ01016105.1.p1 GENE.GHVQ01016105.1~~GHVQ01016105.1.p1  ORF type:complete len:217 (+),score=33.89 GHVQ01016105.1:475-1125(+)
MHDKRVMEDVPGPGSNSLRGGIKSYCAGVLVGDWYERQIDPVEQLRFPHHKLTHVYREPRHTPFNLFPLPPAVDGVPLTFPPPQSSYLSTSSGAAATSKDRCRSVIDLSHDVLGGKCSVVNRSADSSCSAPRAATSSSGSSGSSDGSSCCAESALCSSRTAQDRHIPSQNPYAGCWMKWEPYDRLMWATEYRSQYRHHKRLYTLSTTANNTSSSYL